MHKRLRSLHYTFFRYSSFRSLRLKFCILMVGGPVLIQIREQTEMAKDVDLSGQRYSFCRRVLALP